MSVRTGSAPDILGNIPATFLIFVPLLLVSWFTAPSPIALLAFLLSVSVIGFRFLSLIEIDPAMGVGLSLPTGLMLAILAPLIPFGLGLNLQVDGKTYFVASMLVVGLVGEILNFLIRKPVQRAIRHIRDGMTQITRYPGGLVLGLFFLALLVRLLFQAANSDSILPDGSLYFAAARSLAVSGKFSANVLADAPIVSPTTYFDGLIPRTGTWFLLGSFFSFNGVSFWTDKLYLIVIGSSLTGPAFCLARSWFGSRPWVAALLVCLQPALLLFSVVPFGPEILSCLLAFSGLAVYEYSGTGGQRAATLVLCGLFLSASMISWDPFVILPYLLAMVLGGHSRTGRRAIETILVAAIVVCFGVTIALSTTWFLNPVVFLLAVSLITLFSWRIWKRVHPLLWITVILAAVYSLWLNRWHAFPQDVINPSLESSIRRVPSYFLPHTLTVSSVSTWTGTLLSGLTGATTFPILVLAALSFLVLEWRLIRRASIGYWLLVLESLMITFILIPYGLATDYSASRAYLVIVFISAVVSGGVLVSLAEGFLGRLGEALTTSRVSRGNSIARRTFPSKGATVAVVAVLVIGIGVSPIMAGYANGYNAALSYMNKVDYPELMGVLNSAAWIRQNTPPGSIFQVASDTSTRVWSMELGDRYFASLFVARDGALVPSANVTTADVFDNSLRIGASYIILDPLTASAGLQQVASLYNEVQVGDAGALYPVSLSNNSLASQNETRLPALQVLYVSPDNSSKVVILRPLTTSVRPVWTIDLGSAPAWNAFLGGSVLSSNNSLTLVAPPHTSGKVYAEYVFPQNVEITNDTYALVRAGSISSGSSAGLYFQFGDGRSTILTFDDTEIHAISLAPYAGQSPKIAFLYCFISAGVSGNSSLSVSYTLLSLADITVDN